MDGETKTDNTEITLSMMFVSRKNKKRRKEDCFVVASLREKNRMID